MTKTVDNAIAADLTRATRNFRVTEVYGAKGVANAIDTGHLHRISAARSSGEDVTMSGPGRADISLAALARAAHNMTIHDADKNSTASSANVFDETQESSSVRLELTPLDGDYAPLVAGDAFITAIRYAVNDNHRQIRPNSTGFKCEWTRARNTTSTTISVRIYPVVLAKLVHDKYSGYAGRQFYHNGAPCRLRAVSIVSEANFNHANESATYDNTIHDQHLSATLTNSTHFRAPIALTQIAHADLPLLLDLAGDHIVTLKRAFDSHTMPYTECVKNSDLHSAYSRGLRDINVSPNFLTGALDGLSKLGWNDSQADVACFLRVMLAARAISNTRKTGTSAQRKTNAHGQQIDQQGMCTVCDCTTYLCSSCKILHSIQPENVAFVLKRLDVYGTTKRKALGGTRQPGSITLPQLNPLDATTCLGNLGVRLMSDEKHDVGRWTKRRLGGVRPFLNQEDVIAMLDWLVEKRQGQA